MTELKQVIAEAVARGWCHPKNASKVMDTDLAAAITAEVSLALTQQGACAEAMRALEKMFQESNQVFLYGELKKPSFATTSDAQYPRYLACNDLYSKHNWKPTIAEAILAARQTKRSEP